MNIVRLATFAMVVSLLPMSAGAIACTPPPDWTAAKQREEEDRAILEADVFYRGVMGNVDISDFASGDTSEASFNKPIVTIRRTRTLWGSGAPAALTLPWGYLVVCPLPNLMDAYWETKDGNPVLRDGWGVTVIGRREDFSDRPDRLFILIDGAPETSRIVSRFQQLRLNW